MLDSFSSGGEADRLSRTPFRLINTRAALEQAVGALSGCRVIGVDTETTALSPLEGKIRLIQISTPEDNFVIDLFKLNAFEHRGLRQVLSSDRPIKVFHNAKFDLKMLLHHFAIEVQGLFDTLLASQLIGAGRREGGHGLAAVSDRHLGELVDKTLQTSDWHGPLSDEQYEYAARDAALMLPLYEKLNESLHELNLEEVARLEFDCVLPIAAMELTGMAVNAECWRTSKHQSGQSHASHRCPGEYGNQGRGHQKLAATTSRERASGDREAARVPQRPETAVELWTGFARSHKSGDRPHSRGLQTARSNRRANELFGSQSSAGS
jgi:hypothetical protein